MARWGEIRRRICEFQERGQRCLLLVRNYCIFKFFSKNGDKFEGVWKDHVKDGVGIYTYAATGKEEILVYENGKLVKQQ